SSGGSRSSTSNPVGNLLAKLGWLGTLLKWIVFGAVALVVAFFLLRSGLRFLANFTNWARRLLDALQAWWQGLFGQRGGPGGAEADTLNADGVYRAVPFSAFHNPFLDGSADRQSPNQLVRYSFEALQAWAT